MASSLNINERISLKRKCSDTAMSDANRSITGIAELHRFCSQYKLEFPCYKIIETVDLLNKKQFTVHCIIKHLNEKGTGKNKKQAKHLASYYLLKKLKDCTENDCSDFMNENSGECSLEEGEIQECEEGEIREDVNVKNCHFLDENDYDSDNSSDSINKYKVKKVYLEGNVKGRNINLANKIKNKTQVQLLAEYCYKEKLPPPKYEIKEHSGINRTILTCQCNVLQLYVKVTGLKKIEVKEKASKLMLIKMENFSDVLQKSLKKDSSIINEIEEGEIVDEILNDNRSFEIKQTTKRRKLNNENTKLKFNCMGELNNFCKKLKIPLPVYTIFDEKNTSKHNKVFTAQCSIIKFTKIGYGFSKKQAKHKAAKLLLDQLQNKNKEDLNNTDSDSLEEGEINENDEVKAEYLIKRTEMNFITRNEKDMLQIQSIADRHDVIKKNEPYTRSKALKELCKLNNSFITKYARLILNKICEEMEVVYYFTDIKSLNNTVTCLYLETIPNWSTFGEGSSRAEAEDCAIRRMVDFLKNMAK